MAHADMRFLELECCHYSQMVQTITVIELNEITVPTVIMDVFSSKVSTIYF